ncbi:Uncharacterised protein [BD1-7 clade bacterium]|uniref:Uncharacterized protein n=1 Tax=BD1-7 clade bacterium TaxID=2029982 RepID=A0A5S9Q719_9GAMM|nr:Uncharacterised protein [BD1-7 clade bacterium]
MISEKDARVLKGLSDTRYNLVQGVFIGFMLFQLFSTFNNLSLAISYGEAMGLSFDQILAMWNAEPELRKLYKGYEVQSLYRLNMAILNFGVALVLAILSVTMNSVRTRNKRILFALEYCGAISKGENA